MRVQAPAARDQWRSILASDRLALPEHAPEWVDAVCAFGPFTDATRLYELADGRRFVLPLVRRAGLGGTGGWLWSLPRGCGWGGLVGPDLDGDVVGAVLDDLAALGAARVVIRPDPLRREWRTVADRPGLCTSARRAHVIDLSEGIDALAARLAPVTRRNLRIAHKRGVRVEVDRDGSLLPVFRRLYRASVTRWAARQNEPVALARWRAARYDPPGKFEAIGQHLGQAFRLYVAHVGDDPVAAIMVTFGRTASYIRGAMDRDRAGPVRANDLLHWTAIQAAGRAGCAHYHMGDSGASTSLARFKQRIGAVPVDYTDVRLERYPITPIDHALRTAVKKAIGFQDAPEQPCNDEKLAI